MKSILTLFAACLALTACAQTSQTFDGEKFGAEISSTEYIGFDDLMMKLQSMDTVVTTMRATVSEVCQMKGCWMTLHGDNATADAEVMVRFKDYGFFVPKNISGKEVVVEGQAYKEVIPVDELKHYAEDAGKSKEEIATITEPKESFAFLATGVVVLSEK